MIWDKKLTQPPTTALKQIKGGRLKGMTDINPQWRYEAMTEVFGLCGIGWRYDVVRKWIEDGVGEERCANVDIELFVKVDDKWSKAIPGTGGSMFVAKESAGPRTNDEAFKMATTDALSTAMKMIGVGNDIYRGRWDGSKYKEEPAAPKEIDLEQLKDNVGLCQTEQQLKDLMKTYESTIKSAANKEDAVALFSERKQEILEG